MNNSISGIIRVLIVGLIGSIIMVLIDDNLGIDSRGFSFGIHDIACMVWGVVFWKASGG